MFLPGESHGREPGGLQSTGSRRVGHNRVTNNNNNKLKYTSLSDGAQPGLGPFLGEEEELSGEKSTQGGCLVWPQCGLWPECSRYTIFPRALLKGAETCWRKRGSLWKWVCSFWENSKNNKPLYHLFISPWDFFVILELPCFVFPHKRWQENSKITKNRLNYQHFCLFPPIPEFLTSV